MKLKGLIASIALAFFGAAQAASGPGFLGPLDNTVVEIGNVVSADDEFTDIYSFTLDSAAAGLSFVFSTSPAGEDDDDQLSFSSVGFYDASDNPLSVDTDGSDGWAVLASLPSAGTYQLKIFGEAEDEGGSYGGFIATASVTPAVPEPETYALLLAGLGVMGFLLRHRRR